MSAVRAILDFPDPHRAVYTSPSDIVATNEIRSVRDSLRAVESACREGATAVGFLAYEAAPAFDRALVARPAAGPAPLLWFALFEGPPGAAPVQAPAAMPPLVWQPDTSAGQYAAAIADIRAAIAAGDVYQVNHTMRFAAAYAGDPLPLYDALVAPRHGRYHALLETADWAIVSASPELFFDLRGRMMTTRPMKGTRRRGRWLGEDRAAAAALAASTKDRAENLMIVDLLRNDLGRIAEFGSTGVPHIFDIETYPTVHQMTSTITAAVRADVRLDDIFAAMFPCGSVTGAPKVTAMRTIARLEPTARGPYCGAVGIVRPDGTATFSVAIRTLLLDRRAHTAAYGAGAGITWDSLADAEYDEVIAKAALLERATPAFALLETMRLHDGAYARLSLHLERVRDSADYWDFPHDLAQRARQRLELERNAAGDGTWRVRLTAARDGAIHITRTRLTHAADLAPAGTHDAAYARTHDVPTVALACTPVSSHDRLLYHKTTARAVYDAQRSKQPRAFDVLLHNELGCVTAFTTGNVVLEMNGELLTPARTCGLLAGTFREQLLRDGVLREAVIPLADLHRASRVWFINSVREWIAVRLASRSS